MIYLLSIQLQHFMNEKASITIKWALYFFFRGWKKTAVSQNGTIWKKQQLFGFPKSFLEKSIDEDWLSSIFCQIIFMFDLSQGKFKFQISKSDITYNFRNHIHWAIFILSRPLCAHILDRARGCGCGLQSPPSILHSPSASVHLP